MSETKPDVAPDVAPGPLWVELREAAAGILRFGDHEGPCTNDDDPDQPCIAHLLHMERRETRLKQSLIMLGR